MARSVAHYIAQISEFMMEVERRRRSLAGLQKKAEPLARNGLIAVSGELSQLDNLQQLLDTAIAEIDALRAVKKREEADAHIERLAEALDDVAWELVEDLEATLKKREEQQNVIIERLQNSFGEWPTIAKNLREALDKALAVRAPVRLKKTEIENVEGTVRRIQRAFTDGTFSEIEGALAELDRNLAKDPAYLEEIQKETETAAAFIRQADLLLLQSPPDTRSLYRYMVLLRTPSEPGTHGINIQEKCTLVLHDRREMEEAIVKITHAVNHGVTRAFHMRRAQSTPPPVEPPPVAPPVEPPAIAPTPAAPQPAEPTVTAPPPVASAAAAPVAAAPGGEGDDGASSDAPETEPAADAARKAELNLPAPGSTDPLFDSLMGSSLNELVKDVGDFMYRIFMSHQLQNYLYETPCSLTITTNDMVLPWELMSYRDKDSPDADKFLCLERPVARMPMGRYFPRKHRPAIPGRMLRFLLIYADPEENLPAAKREVDKIYDCLPRDQVDVDMLEGKDVTGRALNEVLRRGAFDVIHFAGHAFFDDDDSDLSGLLLHDKEHFLAQKVHRLLEGRPLVFLNACQSGFTANDDTPPEVKEYMQEKAEGLASAFIYGGATGCVGSLWPIYDEPAADFAVHFYNNVLKGYMVGEAMRLARREIKEKHNDQITWAAYVLYGDPTFRL